MHWVTSLEGGPRRVNHAAALVGKYIYSFGGYCTGEDSREFRPMDVHALQVNTLRWRNIPLTQTNGLAVPFHRYGHTAIAYGKNIYIWGGRNDEFSCNILYEFNTVTKTWSTPNVTGMIPGPRDGHSACLYGHKMYIFGGYEEDEEEFFSNEVYMLDLEEFTWHFISTQGTPPSFRDFHSAVVLLNRMYIFGGRWDRSYPNLHDDEIYSSKIVYLDFETYQWVKPNQTGDIPFGRRSHSAFVYNGFMYIFGGYNGNIDTHYNEIYQFNPTNAQWKLVEAIGQPPCPRRRQTCIMVDDRMYLFGGTSPTGIPIRYTFFLDDEEPSDLKDHSDLFILDFKPTLRTLSLISVINYNLDTSCIPVSLQEDIKYLTTRNHISKPLDQTKRKRTVYTI